MTREEQNTFMSTEYAEANRYMENAKETLKKAGRNGLNYADKKYVRTACGTAYNGLLVALDALFILKGIPVPRKKQRKSIEYYTFNIAKLDKKILSNLDVAYDVLHLAGYYDGILSVKMIESGFDAAYEIIDRIKPENPVEVPETRSGRIKRAWNAMLIAVAVAFMRS
jgi:uncharacterized protein (UPF0332 family)